MIKIEIPMLPPHGLSPNARLHWAERFKAAQEFRTATAMGVMGCGGWHPMERATIQATFVVTTQRRRDPDNWLAMLKPALDFLVDTGILIDDDWAHVELLSPRFVVDKVRAPMTVLEIDDISNELLASPTRKAGGIDGL